jgi:hypothetical protein
VENRWISYLWWRHTRRKTDGPRVLASASFVAANLVFLVLLLHKLLLQLLELQARLTR